MKYLLCFTTMAACIATAASAGWGGSHSDYLSTKQDIAHAKPDTDYINIRDLPLQDYSLLSKFKPLRKVSFFGLEGTLGTDDKMKALAALNFTNLSYVNLINCRLITDAGIRALSKIPTLGMLVLEGTAITDDACEVMASKMQLSVLRVSNCTGVTLKGLKALAASDTLTHLQFSADRLTQDAILDLIGSFKGITWCEITDTQRKLEVSALKAKGAERKIKVVVLPNGAMQDLRR